MAGEVRTLAQRSAAAAKEIKALIDDSVGKVEAGTQLVDQAGATMEQVVDSIRKVTDIVAEITSASAEQSAGIEQVNRAIADMDASTQHNAALVEESAAAAALAAGPGRQAGRRWSACSTSAARRRRAGSARPAARRPRRASPAPRPQAGAQPRRASAAAPPPRRRLGNLLTPDAAGAADAADLLHRAGSEPDIAGLGLSLRLQTKETTMSYEERDDYGMYKNKHGKGPGPELMGAHTLIGDHVHNLQNEHLGVIKEFMVDMRSGRHRLCRDVVQPLPRPGRKTVRRALAGAHAGHPRTSASRWTSRRNASTNAPGFDTDHWPDMADPRWANELHAYFGTRPV